MFEGLAMEQLEKKNGLFILCCILIFSELNNLQNISMSDDYSAICGITEQELLSQMQPDIERIAQANDETYEEACRHLKRQYDGYHFSKNCEDIYNPFSLFNAFSQKDYKSFGSLPVHPLC